MSLAWLFAWCSCDILSCTGALCIISWKDTTISQHQLFKTICMCVYTCMCNVSEKGRIYTAMLDTMSDHCVPVLLKAGAVLWWRCTLVWQFGFRKWKSHVTERPIEDRSDQVKELYSEQIFIKPYTGPWDSSSFSDIMCRTSTKRTCLMHLLFLI